MPHRQGEVKTFIDVAASKPMVVSELVVNDKIEKVQQQLKKSVVTNGNSPLEITMEEQGEDNLLDSLNKDTVLLTNGHSKSNDKLPETATNAPPSLEDFARAGAFSNGYHHDKMENGLEAEEQNGHSGYLDIPSNGFHSNNMDFMEVYASPPVKNSFLSYDPAIMTTLSEFNNYTNGLRDNNFDESEVSRPKKIYRVVLTGGPCGGKTTGQARLCTFFENLGWKVFRVPEAATVLLGGGIKFSELTPKQSFRFQEELLRTMMQIESVFFRIAETINQDVLIICDRGSMDASAFISRDVWETILQRNQLNEIDIRDTRYNQIIHMVSAANGAEPFYTIEDHVCREEGMDLARTLDQKAAQAWVGHPYFDVVDNSTDFETKLCRMIQCVCQKLGIDTKDRLKTNTKKVKFLVRGPLPPAEVFPENSQDFSVVHDYLQTHTPKMQARLRKRGLKGHWSYTYTVRRPELQGQVVETKTTLTQRDYQNMLSQKENNHVTVYKTRKCFLLNDQYFQLDIYKEPCHPRCHGLMLLETYTTLPIAELQQRIPTFLQIVREVTGDPKYSMFNLSLREGWKNNVHFCKSLIAPPSSHPIDNSEETSSENRLVEC